MFFEWCFAAIMYDCILSETLTKKLCPIGEPQQYVLVL